jgi:uncharacterized protein (DUF58 family)
MLTRRGAAVVVATIGTYVCAAGLHYTELAVLAAGGLLAVLFGLFWVLWRPHLAVTRTIEPSRVTRGDVALGLLKITNEGRLAANPSAGEEPCGPQVISIGLPRLASDETNRAQYRLPTERRAVLDVGPFTIARQDPFGLWRTSQKLGSMERLYVYPVVHKLLALPVGQTRSLDGPDRDGLPHGSTTFHALREYVPGDDLRHIHWRSSARTGTLMVREHVDTSLPQVTLLLDSNANSYIADEFEDAVEVAASIAVAVVRAGLPVRLITSSGEGTQGSVGGSEQQFLDFLAGVSVAPGRSMLDLVNRLSADRRGDVLLVVTGRASIDEMTAVGALGGRYNRGSVVLVGERSDDVPAPVPRHMRVTRVHRASDFAREWERTLAK